MMIHATQPPPSRRYRGRPARRGAVLIVMITAITLLVGLVFFVINLGDQVNRRLSLQNAADSAAISGAGYDKMPHLQVFDCAARKSFV